MIKELDRIILNKDIPEDNLKKGDLGIVVLVHHNSKGYEVEFTTLDGVTIAVKSLFAEDIREIRKHEIANARVI